MADIQIYDATTGLCVAYNASSAPHAEDCCPAGWFLQVDLPISVGTAILCCLVLCWVFLGVAMGADVFMTSIAMITSKETVKKVKTGNGKEKIFHVRVWNDTIANLTLMALGSSAPEILINVLEVVLEDFYAGALGPSTIVGSAAFNLMVITAVCVIALPAGESRTLKQLGVFLVTASFSVLAYIWLLVIVVIWTPDVITVVEGALTCCLLLVLLILAYIADKRGAKQVRLRKAKGEEGESYEALREAGLLSEVRDASPEALAKLLEDYQPVKNRAHYRHMAMMSVPGHTYVCNVPRPLRREKTEAALEDLKSIELKGGVPQPQTQTPSPADGSSVTPVVVPDGDARDGNGMDSPPAPPRPSMADVGKSVTSPSLDFKPRRTLTRNVPRAGVLQWAEDMVSIKESAGDLVLRIQRAGGKDGEVKVQYTTKDQQARAGKDYVAIKGELTFADGETSKDLKIEIIDDDELEKDEHFTVVLSEPTNGAIFDSATDGGDNEAICTVTILNDDTRASKFVRAMQLLRLNDDEIELSAASYAEQVREVFSLPEKGTGAAGWVMHFLALPWRFMFALVPPPSLLGGWPCFWMALLGIAIQVILISDFANMMGCQMTLKPGVTAITFVALGTSLPDLFASKQAAIDDKTADNSVGNVTGSNSVNVFFGLGFPWLLSAIVWQARGQWSAADRVKYAHLPHVLNNFPNGAFVVESGDLGFSVMVFVICALITISVVLLRRPHELGGNRTTAKATAALFVGLWFTYVTMSSLATYKAIPTF